MDVLMDVRSQSLGMRLFERPAVQAWYRGSGELLSEPSVTGRDCHAEENAYVLRGFRHSLDRATQGR
jgi:hypothetical protein